MGYCITTAARLFLPDSIEFKFRKSHNLPFALKPVASGEFDRLEKQGVIEKVPHSDWETPIVVVRKP